MKIIINYAEMQNVKKTALILSIIILLIAILGGILSGGIKLKLSITKTNETEENQTVSVAENKETIPETQSIHDGDYYPSIEELLKVKKENNEGVIIRIGWHYDDAPYGKNVGWERWLQH